MDRHRLAWMLERDEAAFAECRQAVLSGARFWVEEAGQPASNLASIYARRERHTRERAIPTLGFVEAVASLRARGTDTVRIGAVDTDDPPYHFQLFINDDGSTVIACIGVDQSGKSA